VQRWILRLLLAAMVSCGLSCGQTTPVREIFQIQESVSPFVYDTFIEDDRMKQLILKIVTTHVQKNQKDHGNLVYEGAQSGKRREFRVVKIFDVVSRKGTVYTVQVDVDEVGGKERLLLFYDVTDNNRDLELTAIRFGGQHLRQG
jgi:hypothetical protein